MKKNKVKLLTIGLLLILLVGIMIMLFLSKDYKNFYEVIEKMDISVENKDKNIKKLEKFAKKNDYIFNKDDTNGHIVVAVFSKDYKQNILYRSDEPSINYYRIGSKKITNKTKEKMGTLREDKDSVKSVIKLLGEPDSMRKDFRGRIEASWGKAGETSSIEFKNKKVLNVKLNGY